MSDPSRLELVIAQCRRAHEHFPSRDSREATASELLVEEIEYLRKCVEAPFKIGRYMLFFTKDDGLAIFSNGEGGHFDELELEKVIADFVSERL